MKTPDYNTVNVTEKYVRELVNSEEFKKFVEKEAETDGDYNEENSNLEVRGKVATYTYCEDGEVIFKEKFYII